MQLQWIPHSSSLGGISSIWSMRRTSRYTLWKLNNSNIENGESNIKSSFQSLYIIEHRWYWVVSLPPGWSANEVSTPYLFPNIHYINLFGIYRLLVLSHSFPPVYDPKWKDQARISSLGRQAADAHPQKVPCETHLAIVISSTQQWIKWTRLSEEHRFLMFLPMVSL